LLDPAADINDFDMTTGHLPKGEGEFVELILATEEGVYFVNHRLGGDYAIS
jgi:hypothetical protein